MNPALFGILAAAAVLGLAIAYLLVQTVVTFFVANPVVPLVAVAVGAMVVAWWYRR